MAEIAPVQNAIGICLQRRNSRTVTHIEGLPMNFNKNKMIETLKTEIDCDGAVVVKDDMAEVLQFQDDQRETVADLLVSSLNIDKAAIKVSGF